MDELALLAKESMQKSIANLKEKFNTLRTGRANAAIFDRVECDYYGDKLPIKDICQISSPEPRQLIVKPYDKGDVKSVYTAIVASDLGLNPTNEGDQIRILIPALTEDKRRELAKKGKGYAEEAKVAIRNIRREFIDSVKKSDEYTDDLKKRIEADIQKVTDEAIKMVDDAYAAKEKEILTV
jgi:ribosome recycling factor